ncbi:hypothetical protein JL721_3579 [Aureococcus anophagefferens]|nr:hypothetical protein JL721_3579 [Aureococcus anophagefferens]
MPGVVFNLEPFVLGFSSRFDGTGFFAYKGHKDIADAETYACDAAAALYEGATPADAKAALGALGPRRYIRIDDFASMLSRGENGALAAVKAAVALRNAVDVTADDEPEPGPEGDAGSQTEDADVEDEPPASPRRRRARAARAAAAVATVTPESARHEGAAAERGVAGRAPAAVAGAAAAPADDAAARHGHRGRRAMVRRLIAEGRTRDLDRDRADAAVNGGLRAQRGGFERKRCRYGAGCYRRDCRFAH